MLDIIFGGPFCGECVMDNRIWFRRHKKPEWFEDAFVKRVIWEIDQAQVLFEEALKDRFGHGMATEKLSSGSKTLICIYYYPQLQFNGSMMGDNCVPLLMEIARERDVHIMLEHFMDLREEDLPYVRVDGRPVTMYEYEYECRYCEWAEWVDTCSAKYYEQVAAGMDVTPVKPDMKWDEI